MAKILIVDIEGTDGWYKLYSDGRVFSNKSGRFLTPYYSSEGYIRFKINNEHRLQHRLLAEHFIPNTENLETVNHIDKDKENNSLSNLEWLSREDNVKHGLQKTYELLDPFGNLHVFTGMNDFCKDMGLSQPNISKVISGERPHHKGWRIYNG